MTTEIANVLTPIALYNVIKARFNQLNDIMLHSIQDGRSFDANALANANAMLNMHRQYLCHPNNRHLWILDATPELILEIFG